MTDLVGTEANLINDEIILGGPIVLAGGKEKTLSTRDGADVQNEIESSERSAAIDLLLDKAKVKLGVSNVLSETINAQGLEIDTLDNWIWVPEGQSFVYAGIRAQSATIDIKTLNELSTGQLEVPELGSVKISAKSNSSYRIEILNPKVYYKVQVGKVDQTFSGNKYSNGWISQSATGQTNVEPIRLIPNSRGKSETWKIQPFQYFWKRWLGGYDMPVLSLLNRDGELFVRSTRGLNSELISLDEYASNGVWNQDSIFITDFPVGEFERKLVILDLKAHREKDDLVIRHARIRYPEVKLNIQ
jgi:hypothetical protein